MMDVDHGEAAPDPDPTQSDVDRLTARIRRFAALSILVATPINLVLTLVAGFAQSRSGTYVLGVIGMPQLAPFLIACYSFLGGFASVTVANRAAVSPRGLCTRRILLGVVIAGTASVPLAIATVWYVLNTHSLAS